MVLNSLWGHLALSNLEVPVNQCPAQTSGHVHGVVYWECPPQSFALEKGLAGLFHLTTLPFPGIQPTSAHTQEALELQPVG